MLTGEQSGLLLLLLSRLGHSVPLHELLNTAFRVNDLLLAREERMARATYLHANLGLDRSCRILSAARTDDLGIDVIGVDSGFHFARYLSPASEHSLQRSQTQNKIGLLVGPD